MASLKKEDWDALGSRLTPDYFESLMNRMNTLDHSVKRLLIDEPACCCPKSLDDRAKLNPMHQIYTQSIEFILSQENLKLAPIQIGIELIVEKEENKYFALNTFGLDFKRVHENPKTHTWLKFNLHYNEGKLHPHDVNNDEDITRYHLPIPPVPPPHPTYPRAQPHLVMPDALNQLIRDEKKEKQQTVINQDESKMDLLNTKANAWTSMDSSAYQMYPSSSNRIYPVMPINPLMHNPHQQYFY